MLQKERLNIFVPYDEKFCGKPVKVGNRFKKHRKIGRFEVYQITHKSGKRMIKIDKREEQK